MKKKIAALAFLLALLVCMVPWRRAALPVVNAAGANSGVSLSSLTLQTNPKKLTYYVGDMVDTSGMKLVAGYSDGSVKEVSSNYTCTPKTFDTLGRQTVTISYGGMTVNFDVNVVKPKTLTDLALETWPKKLTYSVGDMVDTSGMKLMAYYDDNSSMEVSSNYNCTPKTFDILGRQTVTISYGGMTVDFDVNVVTKKPLQITAQPKTVVVLKGGTVRFTVGASGDGLGYQWQISDDAGQTWRSSAVKSATYTTTLSSQNNGRRMRCVVSDQYGSQVTSNAAAMWMSGLKITQQPRTAVVLNGGTVRFTVAAGGEGLTYQWQISDDAGKTWRNSAVKTAAYTTTLSSQNNGRRMRCVVSDKYGNSVTSNAAAMWMSGLKITQQPQNTRAQNNGTVQFTVKANGDGVTYRWQISDDGGKTWRSSAVKTPTYTTTLTNANNGRRMRCVVSDKYGNSVTSGAAAMWLINA